MVVAIALSLLERRRCGVRLRRSTAFRRLRLVYEPRLCG